MNIVFIHCIVLLQVYGCYSDNSVPDVDYDAMEYYGYPRTAIDEAFTHVERLMHYYNQPHPETVLPDIIANSQELSNHIGEGRTGVVGKVLDGTVGIIKKIADSLNNMGHKALNEVDHATKSIEQGMKNVETKLMKIMDAQRVVFVDKMSNLTSKFENRIVAAGYSVANCQEESHDDAEQLFTNTVKGGYKCAQDRVVKLVVLLKNLGNLGKRSLKLSSSIIDKLTGCGEKDGYWKGTCLGGLYLDAQAKQALVGAEVASMLNQVRITISSIPLLLGTCTIGVGFKTAWGITKIIGKTSFCYAKSILSPKEPPQIQSK